MEKQKLYVGKFYENGPRPDVFNGKKVLVIGHQPPATDNDRKAALIGPDELKKTMETNNVELISALWNGEADREWEPKRRNTFTWFSNIVHYPISPLFMSEEWVVLYKSISYFNFIQVPCYNENRMGDNPASECEFAMKALFEYVDECKPDRIIVWGEEAFRHISNNASSISEDKSLCVLMINNIEYKFLQIHHPQGANKEFEHNKIKEFMD